MSNEAHRRGEGSEQSTGSKEYQDQLAQLLSEVARTIERERGGLDETLEAILRTAVETVPGATCASITEVRRRQELSVRLSTDDLARRCDELQYEVGEGPCLDAAYEHRTVRIEDLWDDNRWPAFSDRTKDLPARSMLSLHLYVDGDDLGALKPVLRFAEGVP